MRFAALNINGIARVCLHAQEDHLIMEEARAIYEAIRLARKASGAEAVTQGTVCEMHRTTFTIQTQMVDMGCGMCERFDTLIQAVKQ